MLAWYYQFLIISLASAIVALILQLKRFPHNLAFFDAPRILVLPEYRSLNFWYLLMTVIAWLASLLFFIFGMIKNSPSKFYAVILVVIGFFLLFIEISSRRERLAYYKKHFESNGS